MGGKNGLIDIDTLPSSPIDDSVAEPPVLIPDVTVADIKDFISPKLYAELSWDDDRTSDEVTASCIDQAKLLAETLLNVAGEKLNLYSATQKLVVKNLTVYFLYQYNGDRYRSGEYIKRAERLISDKYENLETARTQKPPVAAVSRPQKRNGRR